MKQSSKKNRWLVLLVIPVVLLLGALFVGVMAFNVTPALAQSAGGGAESPAETEGSADADDGDEGPDVPITGSALEQASATRTGDPPGLCPNQLHRPRRNEVRALSYDGAI